MTRSSAVASRALPRRLLYSIGRACVVIPLLSSCERQSVGICAVFYRDPVITVVSVSDASTSLSLGSVLIGEVKISGNRVSPIESLVAVNAPVTNVEVLGDRLRCTVACGFGNMPGTYEMRLHHDGYRDTTVVVVARYARKQGNSCPVTFSQGSVLNVGLQPE